MLCDFFGEENLTSSREESTEGSISWIYGGKEERSVYLVLLLIWKLQLEDNSFVSYGVRSLSATVQETCTQVVYHVAGLSSPDLGCLYLAVASFPCTMLGKKICGHRDSIKGKENLSSQMPVHTP